MDSIKLNLVKGIVAGYDLATLPLYAITQRPWSRYFSSRRVRAVQVDPSDPNSPWVRIDKPPETAVGADQENVADVMRVILRTYGDGNCLGVRKVLSEQSVPGIPVPKKSMAEDFEFMSFREVNKKIDDIARGFLSIGIKQYDTVIILMETRREFLLSAQALFRIGATLGTLYATLGDDGVVFGANQLESTHLITSESLLPKLIRIAPQIKNLTTVVYTPGNTDKAGGDFETELKLISFTDIETTGSRLTTDISSIKVKGSDTAVIMFTSGSTGTPKGVIITHANLVSCMNCLNTPLSQFNIQPGEPYCGYLPLAHMFEFCVEHLILAKGGAVCYSSPFTLTDKSPSIVEGQKGDVSIVKPGVIACVPLILERIKKAIESEIRTKGPFVERLFAWAISYKMKWLTYGFRTPLLDRLLFKKAQQVLGGRIRVIISGGAPLPDDVHVFFRTVFNAEIFQGFGMTETCAVCNVMDGDEMSTGRCGAPVHFVKVKLLNWEDGGYRNTDQPRPRGEILINCGAVCNGYYKRPEETEEVFKEIDGERWYYTGDIGEIYEDGTIKIIDRKKDLIKLSMGEFLSLGKIESAIKGSIFVENTCVYGDGKQNYLIALITPSPVALNGLAKKLGKEGMTIGQLCDDQDVINEVLKSIRTISKERGLTSLETPQKIRLCERDWTPDNGLVTAALKIRRIQIRQYYQADIDRLYSSN